MSDESPPSGGSLPVLSIADQNLRPRRSAQLSKIAGALAKAQGEMLNAEKDVKGNYGKYATLAATWDAIRQPLAKNEIAVYQRILTIEKKPTMCTMLIHSSGEFLDDCELELIFDRSGGRITPMQAMGSAVTYARRYSLQAVTGVAPADDDDGNGAGKPNIEPSGPLPQKKPADKPPAKAPAGKSPPAEKKPTGNFAPADDAMIEQLYSLAIDRQVSEGVLNVLIQAYGVKPGTNPPVWAAKEIGKLLENEDANEATVMAESQRVISRREAARIKEEAEKQKGGG